MKRGAFCLALFGWPMSGAADAATKAPVAVYARFEHQPPGSASELLRRELRAILSPAGFEFEWRSATDPSNETWAALAVVQFKGHCDARDLARAVHFAGGALGWTHVSNGRILPFIEVDCDRIGAFLESGLFALPLPVREKAFQRAIARVVAHELYHVFTETTAHGSRGVAKASFSAEELLSDQFRFQSREARALSHKGAQAWLQFSLRAQ